MDNPFLKLHAYSSFFLLYLRVEESMQSIRTRTYTQT